MLVYTYGLVITKTALHATIDDSTGHVVATYFDNHETLNGYYNIYYQILTKYGIPYLFKTDKRTVFEYKYLSNRNFREIFY